MHGSAVGCQQYVKRAVIIDVGISRAPCHFWSRECSSNLRCSLFELAISQISKQMWRLRIAHALLHPLDFGLDVAGGDQDVRPAVVVIVEEETAEPQRHESCPADF